MAGADQGTAFERGHGQRRPAVVSQRAELWIAADEIIFTAAAGGVGVWISACLIGAYRGVHETHGAVDTATSAMTHNDSTIDPSSDAERPIRSIAAIKKPSSAAPTSSTG